MSYDRSVDLLLDKGVEFWNDLRKNALEGTLEDDELVSLVWDSDFSNVNFFWAFLDSGQHHDDWPISLAGVVLREANLSDTMLRGVDLTEADFEFSRLSDAYLSDSVLRRAILRNAFLGDALLDKADLTSADLRGAVLTDADLRDAILDNADVTTTNLIGADLSGTELWKAKLFSPNTTSPSQFQGQQKPIGSISGLLTAFRRIKSHHKGKDGDILFYFRGEPQCGWKLIPSVIREQFDLSESEMLLEFMSRRPEEFSKMPSSLAQWMLAQHHGLKTRFLDVTKNPLVALFHACEDSEKYKNDDARLHVFAVPRSLIKSFNSDTASVITNFAKLSKQEQDLLLGKKVHPQEHSYGRTNHYRKAMDRLCQFIQEEKPYFRNRIDIKDLFRVIVVEPQQLSERLRAQSGAFLLSAFHERFERREVEGRIPTIPVYAHYTLSIPHRRKPRIIEDLNLINIRRETLYPGLDESAKAIILSQ